MLIVVALPGEAFAVSLVAVGASGCGSVLSGLPSPSESGFNGFVPSITSSPFVTPSLSQSNADHTVFEAPGAVVYEHGSFGLVPFVF